MKKFCLFILLFAFLYSPGMYSQDIQVIVDELSLSDTLGSEIVFDIKVVNISIAEQTVFEVRTINQLPANWTSSLCFGTSCFPPGVDSIATTPDFFTPPLQPGDTLETSLHVFSFSDNGTANVQIQVATFRRPSERFIYDFVASTFPVNINDPVKLLSYSLMQNYPNPFNPSTKISYSIPDEENVKLAVYDITGKETEVLVNENQHPGNYIVEFDGSRYSSGIYFCILRAGSYSAIRKLVLLK